MAASKTSNHRSGFDDLIDQLRSLPDDLRSTIADAIEDGSKRSIPGADAELIYEQRHADLPDLF